MIRHVAVTLAILVVMVGCSPAPSPSPSPSPSPTASRTSSPPTAVAAPSAAALQPGLTRVPVPEAGLAIPVPDAWRLVSAAELADPATVADLAATYPGAQALLSSMDSLGSRATPVFLAVDGSAAGTSAALTPNISVLVTQPPVGGPLLDFVAGFIADGLAGVLGADAPERERVQLAVGEAIRLRYATTAPDGTALRADAWVIGAPAGTVLVTLMGPAAVVDGLAPDALAAAISPLEGGGPTASP